MFEVQKGAVSATPGILSQVEDQPECDARTASEQCLSWLQSSRRNKSSLDETLALQLALLACSADLKQSSADVVAAVGQGLCSILEDHAPCTKDQLMTGYTMCLMFCADQQYHHALNALHWPMHVAAMISATKTTFNPDIQLPGQDATQPYTRASAILHKHLDGVFLKPTCLSYLHDVVPMLAGCTCAWYAPLCFSMRPSWFTNPFMEMAGHSVVTGFCKRVLTMAAERDRVYLGHIDLLKQLGGDGDGRVPLDLFSKTVKEAQNLPVGSSHSHSDRGCQLHIHLLDAGLHL